MDSQRILASGGDDNIIRCNEFFFSRHFLKCALLSRYHRVHVVNSAAGIVQMLTLRLNFLLIDESVGRKKWFALPLGHLIRSLRLDQEYRFV